MSGTVIVSGSHGGRYPGDLAACGGTRAVILNDQTGALACCEALGIAAVTVPHRYCRQPRQRPRP